MKKKNKKQICGIDVCSSRLGKRALAIAPKMPKTSGFILKMKWEKCCFSILGRDRKHDSKRQFRLYIHHSHASYLFFSIRTLMAFILDAFTLHFIYLPLEKKTASVCVLFQTVSLLTLYLFYLVFEHYI